MAIVKRIAQTCARWKAALASELLRDPVVVLFHDDGRASGTAARRDQRLAE